MKPWYASLVAIRTTHGDGDGLVYDVVTGMGVTPELALAQLRSQAQETASETVRKAAASAEATQGPANERTFDSRLEDQEWRFEVVDVRLTPGPIEGADSGWLAYGTLVRESVSGPL
jgi:hypothetical protein